MNVHFTETVKKQQKIIPINNLSGYFISIYDEEPTLVKNKFKIVNNRLLLHQEKIKIPDDLELPMNLLMKHLSGDLDKNGLRPIDERMIKIMRSIGMDIESLVS